MRPSYSEDALGLKPVSRFDSVRARARAVPAWAQPALAAVGAISVFVLVLGLIALIFQLFFRYQYLENNGVLWRIDRLTQQMCQVHVGEAMCAADSPAAAAPAPVQHKFSVSTSTSISTSLSTSTSLKSAVPKHKR
ncbi:hypothetical protein [Trebonia sp.]|uniref:hypothetical protein n=1 Tax=Trebonia sp. TaxID=2767075 RepID=UPI00262589EB|nr:hypothetical protein [Trebonia sp.]